MGAGNRDYVPAAPQLWLYDALVIVLARAPRWRRALLAQLAPREGDVIADVGCGTGTQLVKIGRAAPGLTLIGIDPDPDVLHRARRKLADARSRVGLALPRRARALGARGIRGSESDCESE